MSENDIPRHYAFQFLLGIALILIVPRLLSLAFPDMSFGTRFVIAVAVVVVIRLSIAIFLQRRHAARLNDSPP